MKESADPTRPRWSWTAVADLIRLRNQSGTWLLLFPSLWALMLAYDGRPPLLITAQFTLGALLMRSLGVVFNDLADRRFDPHVARTSRRPLADGRLTPTHALMVALGLTLAAGLLVVQLNRLTILLSPIALGLAAIYPFCKRWIHVPQAVLGIAFGWGAIMAWSAARGAVEGPAWLLFAATIWWAIAYDTIYALQDQEDDRRIGVKSSALFFGAYVPAAVGLCFGGMLLCLWAAGAWAGLGRGFYLGLVGAAGLFMYQVLRLRNPVSPSDAFNMFRRHVYVGAGVLVSLWLGTFTR